MLLNKLLPFAMDAAPPGVSGEGVGGARKRMKKPNFSMSLIASRAAGGGVSGGPVRGPGDRPPSFAAYSVLDKPSEFTRSPCSTFTKEERRVCYHADTPHHPHTQR